jgi:hypothetical protein
MQDFLQGRPSHPATNGAALKAHTHGFVGMEPQNTNSGVRHAESHGGAQSTVELIREDGQIKRIIVQCPCGERIELECDY